MTYLYNNLPRNYTLLATETTVSDFRSVVQGERFPIYVCPGSMQIREWFGRTVQLSGIDASDSDVNLANHPFGAISREVVVTEGHADRSVLHVPFGSMEQARDGMLYTLSSGCLRRFMGRCAATVYPETSGNMNSKYKVERCIEYVKK